jgi:hypothetical protein
LNEISGEAESIEKQLRAAVIRDGKSAWRAGLAGDAGDERELTIGKLEMRRELACAGEGNCLHCSVLRFCHD